MSRRPPRDSKARTWWVARVAALTSRAARRRKKADGWSAGTIRTAIDGASVSAPDLTLPAKAARPPRAPLSAPEDETTWRTLSVFCTYRVVLAFFVAGAFFFANRYFNLGIQAPKLVTPTVIAYVIAAVA